MRQDMHRASYPNFISGTTSTVMVASLDKPDSILCAGLMDLGIIWLGRMCTFAHPIIRSVLYSGKEHAWKQVSETFPVFQYSSGLPDVKGQQTHPRVSVWPCRTSMSMAARQSRRRSPA